MSLQSCVIVGAGQAGAQAAISLRQLGFDGDISLIGDEPVLPYQRPPLSKKFLAGEVDTDALLLRPIDYYRQRRIDVLTHCAVSGIDRQAQVVVLAGGRRLHYDRLLLATGGRARRLTIPGAGLAGVHAIRSIADISCLRAEIATGLRVVLIGGGYIGLETAAVLRGLGCEVRVLEAEARLLSRVAPPAISTFLARAHAREGVGISLNAQVAALTGEQRVTGVCLADGRVIAADIVIVGVGLVPNIELAQRADLRCEGGIVVDENCRSSDPAIYAAGDVTAQFQVESGRTLRIESVENAVWQGKAAARAMLGLPVGARELPWFWSDQYQHKLQIAGLRRSGDREVLRGDLERGVFGVFYLREGRLGSAYLLNQPAEFAAARALIAGGAVVSESALSDAAMPLRQLRQAA